MKLFQMMRERRRRGQAVRDLKALSPEILADIGIEPGTEAEAVRSLLLRKEAAAKAAPRPLFPVGRAAAFTSVSWNYPGR